MTVERAIRILAGTMVLMSVILSSVVDPRWVYLAVFVGCNLIQSAFTGLCPAETIFRRCGLSDGTKRCEKI